MERRENYDIAKIKARPYFLAKDQSAIIDKFALEHDESYIYADFLYRRYRIERKTAAVEFFKDNVWNDCVYEEVLSVYDLLGYSDEKPYISGEWRTVNSLPGVAQTSGLGDNLFSGYAKRFSLNEDGFIDACKKLGGEPVKMGDAAFVFKIFADLPILMRIYRADDEFDAQITLLWDKNTLNYVHYETTYYIAGVLFKRIVEQSASTASGLR